MSERIVCIGTKVQVSMIKKDPSLAGLTNSQHVEWCSDIDEVDTSIRGSSSLDKGLWNLPSTVIYTGQVREYDELGTGRTITNQDRVLNKIKKYGIPSQKIDVPYL